MHEAEPFDLDAVGAIEGTDKSSSVAWAWDYLRHYQDQFAPWRHEPINFIEIGVAGGPSLRVWTTFFTRAHIIGVDIEPKCRNFAGDRVTIEIGSQYDAEFMCGICAKYPPTIVIDDGSHLAHHIVFTFEQVFPLLLPGGLYVVEDTEFQFPRHGKHWQGDGSVSVPDYFATLARDRMANGCDNRGPIAVPKHIAEQIDSITFIGGSIVMRKRRPRDVAAALAFAASYVAAQPDHAWRQRRLAEFILRHGGPLDRAHEAAQRAISLGDHDPAAFAILVSVLERQSRFTEAAEAAAQAAQRWPDHGDVWQMLARVHRRGGDTAAAVAALRAGTAANPKFVPLHRDFIEALEDAGDLQGALAAASAAAAMCAGGNDYPYFVGRTNKIRKRIGSAVP